MQFVGCLVFLGSNIILMVVLLFVIYVSIICYIFAHIMFKYQMIVMSCSGMKEHYLVHTGNSFPFPHMFSLNIIWKTWIASFSRPAWQRWQKCQSKLRRKKQLANISTSLAFKYLHEELGAFRHEQPEDKGRREAGNRAEHHKQSPALKVQRSQRKMCPGSWNHQPGQTCRRKQSYSLLNTCSDTSNGSTMKTCFYFILLIHWYRFISCIFPPAARMFPAIQKVARELIIAPLLRRGMNSEK